MTEQNPNDLDQVQQYRKLVLEYEALDEEIDALLERNHGATEKMSDEDFEHYRELAFRRDYVYNQMKAMERRILLDDSDSR
ncbi:MAG TPA: hypothetical protein VHO69_15375 [Phototrophicaceae bacterium]|nr:hypothetical protein [Phototrophicaceae bacterium]HEX3053849.1 hypothetical protein [Aggregatilineaceae bacterium]